MGRYYNGDIEGKFWFAVQPSNDADFFGVQGVEPEELNYYFEEEDKEEVKGGIKKCKKALGKYKAKLDNFFKENDGYNDEMIVKALKVTEGEAKDLLKWYARLNLGEKIYNCIEEQGYCHFTAEC